MNEAGDGVAVSQFICAWIFFSLLCHYLFLPFSLFIFLLFFFFFLPLWLDLL